MKNQYFTLVELLVVIAIISILAALLLPTLQSAIQSASDITCMNNQRQIAAVMHYYADDNEDQMLWVYYTPATGTGGTFAEKPVEGGLLDYLGETYAKLEKKDFGIWRCPMNTKQKKPCGAGRGEEQTSYTANGQTGANAATNTWASDNRFMGTKRTLYAKPSKLVNLFDGVYFRFEAWYNDGTNALPALNPGIREARWYAHSMAVMVVFADQHAERQDFTELTFRGNQISGTTGNLAPSYPNGYSWHAR